MGVSLVARHGRIHGTAVIAAAPPTEAQIASAEAQMTALVNGLRRSLGLGELAHQDGVAAVARSWSQTLSADGQPFEHNPNYTDQYPPGWQLAAENIARVALTTTLSDAVRQSFDNLANSPPHGAVESAVGPVHRCGRRLGTFVCDQN